MQLEAFISVTKDSDVYPVRNWVEHCTNIRRNLINNLSQICTISLDTLMYGDNSLSLPSNNTIFRCVQAFIKDSKRF